MAAKRAKKSKSAKPVKKSEDDLDIRALYGQSTREMARNKGRIEAGETFASGRRTGREGAPSSFRNRT